MGVVLVFHGRGGPLRLTNSPWTGHPPLSGLPGWFLALKHPPVHVGLITRHGSITVIIIAIRCMEAPENCCAFCVGSCTLRLRCNLSTILRSGGPLCSFLKTIWPALWRQLSASTHTVYVCRLYCQALDTGANCFSSLKQSIVTLEQSHASSRFYPLASRTAAIISYSTSLATSSSTLRKHSGSTEIPSRETFIAALLATMVHTSIYSHVTCM